MELNGRYELSEAIPRNLCTDCGLSRTRQPQRCGKACQFIHPNYSKLEIQVHGRERDSAHGDELFFGPYIKMHQAWAKVPTDGAQWSGLTTKLAEKLLDSDKVEAILTVTSDPLDIWRPVPTLITSVEQLKRARGMRMGYAPLLALLEPAYAQGIRRIAVIGIPCQVYALRSIETELEFERILVIGTPCSDNTTTENFHRFLARLTDHPEDVTYLEFRTDYKVELRFKDGRQSEIPFLKLPLSDLPNDFFPLTCRTCVDYTNVLSDITIGYMAGDGEQWVIVRNSRCDEIFDLLRSEAHVKSLTSRGRRFGAVKGFIGNVERAAGGLPVRKMPDWLRPLMAWLQPIIGPRGLEFARARIEMKAAESVLHLRMQSPKRSKYMLPDFIWKLVAPYGIQPDSKTEVLQDDFDRAAEKHDSRA